MHGGTHISSERMKRMNADPVFAARRDASSGERMKRLHADPEFVAKQAAGAREAMKRLNADAALAAKKAAARSILTKAIVAALRVDPNATRVAQRIGVVAGTVRRIAKTAGVKLTKGRPRRNRSEPPDPMPPRSQLEDSASETGADLVGRLRSRNAAHLLLDSGPTTERSVISLPGNDSTGGCPPA
jgi:hypothetical protein